MPSSPAVRPPGAPTATSTRSARSSRSSPAPRSSACHLGVADLLATLSAQQIPADTLAERGARGSAVRLLTAHRSKGLEWRLVVVAHVQQEAWPDLRRRATLLQADRIGTHGLVPPVERPRAAARGAPALLRRLHPRPRAARRHRGEVARGRRRAALAASSTSSTPRTSPTSWGARSRPLSHDRHRRRPAAHPGRPGDAPRRCATPPPGGWPGSPASRSATVALAPQADPSTWWGTRAASYADEPVRSPDAPVPISATHARGPDARARPSGSSSARPAGSAAPTRRPTSARCCTRSPSGSPAARWRPASSDVDVLMAHVEDVWGRMSFRTPWSAAREHARVRGGAGAGSCSGTTATAARCSAVEQQLRDRGDPRRGRVGGRRPAHRLRRPARARPDGSWSWSTSRPAAASRPTSR